MGRIYFERAGSTRGQDAPKHSIRERGCTLQNLLLFVGVSEGEGQRWWASEPRHRDRRVAVLPVNAAANGLSGIAAEQLSEEQG